MDLDTPLIYLSKNKEDALTTRDGTRGIIALGGTGSGKTSGFSQMLARSMVEKGFGGTVMTGKANETQNWINIVEKAGRMNDLIIFEEGGKYKINFLDYAGEIENIVSMFVAIMAMGDRAGTGQGQGNSHDPFWEKAMKRALRTALILLKLACKKITLANIIRVISEAPLGPDHLKNFMHLVTSTDQEDHKILDTWSNESLTVNCLAWAYYNAKTNNEQREFDIVKSYFLSDFSRLAENTRTSITEHLYAFADPFRSGLLAKYFTEETTPQILPQETFKGKIILLNFPVKKYLHVGIYAQAIYKYLWQQAVESRDTKLYPKPVFLWMDECQYFINEQDMRFQATARESLACTVMITQNLSNLYATIGGANPKEHVQSILGNLATKIFHANDDPVTNTFGADLIGHTFQEKDTYSMGGSGGSMAEQRHYQVEPHKFTMLRTGGPNNKFKIDAIVTCAGKKWSNGKNYIETVFKQNI